GMAGAGEPGVRDDSSAALRWRARREAAGSQRDPEIDAGCRGVDCGVHGSAGARCVARTGFDCDCDCELFLYGFFQARYAVDYFGLGCFWFGGLFRALMLLTGGRSLTVAVPCWRLLRFGSRAQVSTSALRISSASCAAARISATS